ncbi:unnamed protein product [Sphagnum troendelagicum]|uniref:DUF2306 domain-containing protein n=1 Tax=Sphagnum troendelagicum TaxID=128251 RepID=A0ABP0U0Y5_9BRYO
MGVKQLHEKNQQKQWIDTVVWWITIFVSSVFSIYTLPFISGKFDIYKFFTLSYGLGRIEEAGLHILRNVRLWQVHSVCALVYVVISPLQFNSTWRNKHLLMHRRLGYVHAFFTVVASITGGWMMVKDSEIGPLGLVLNRIVSPWCIITLVLSINAARRKDLQSHRRWMLRSATIGYGLVYTRFLPGLISLMFFCTMDTALECSFFIVWVVNPLLLEIYIQMYLTDATKKRATKSIPQQEAKIET